MNRTLLAQELAAVRSLIDDAAKINDSRARDALGDLIGAGGKLLRPRLLILSAMTGTYDPGRIRPLAAALELLHTATLLHDDVIDDAPVRRGVAAVHTRIGRKDAVLSGDFLFSRAFLLAADRTSPENARGLARAINIMVSAELAQDTDRWHFSPSVRACIRKIGGKTAALFALAARAGAVEAKVPARQVSSLSRAAWAAGIAFQIQDDVLDWTGDESELGKAVLNDIREGFCTLPLAYALADDHERLARLLTPEAVRDGAAAEIATLVCGCGALERAAATARLYRDRALADLQKVPPGFARDELAAIFTAFTDRRR